MTLPDYDPAAPGPVPSPCVNICRMDRRTGLCEGCYRTIDEITRWSTADDGFKRAVWTEVRRREQAQFDAPPSAAANVVPAGRPPAPGAPSAGKAALPAGLRLFDLTPKR